MIVQVAKKQTQVTGEYLQAKGILYELHKYQLKQAFEEEQWP